MKGSTVPTVYRRLGAGMAGLTLAFTAACTGSGGSDTNTTGAEASGNEVKIEISPEDGATKVRPNLPVTVSADGGTLTDVQVEQSGGTEADAQNPADGDTAEGSGDGRDEVDKVTGTLNKDKTEWVSDWNLIPGSNVTVTAVAENAAGEETEVVSEFTTLEATPGKRLELKSNFPTSGQEVGVGMPIVVNFDLPVENKEQVENSIEVTSEKPVEGAWNWFGDKEAVFRPKEYWKPNQKVSVDMHLAGTEASEGAYGVENHRLEFTVGRKQVSTIENDDYTMTVEREGKKIKTFPISMGKATTEKYTTTSGTHVVMEKYDRLVMDSSTVGVPVDSPEGYKLDVDYAVRFSDSGEFTHAAPWNSQLGQANLSHGCPNMSVSDAKWYYENSLMGDILQVNGTDRELAVDNGWGFWQRSWDEWLDNSVTGKADTTDGKGTPGNVHGGAA
ncbi:Ig-like domain-containing protein [Nocardiopsis rhodophaea]|uniref:Ig-like domain-containing protein n=2 Tax=Nocardiopsis rhodophaea TaxID=280238 RepID=A0ABN2SG91_9ACTN